MPGARSTHMLWTRLSAIAALAIVALIGVAAWGGDPAQAGVVPTQLLPSPNHPPPEADEEESEDADEDEEEEEGSSRGEDMKDGVLRPPRTGDDEAVKMPPAETLPPSPPATPRQ